MSGRPSGARRAHFRLSATTPSFNGARQARVTVEQEAGGRQVVRVRPFRQREFVLPLATVAELVIWKVERAENWQAAGVRRRSSPKR